MNSQTTPASVRYALLISIALSGMLVPLNSTMIAVALPGIMQTFGIELSAGRWLVIAYLITMAVLQLFTGQLGNRYGRRRLVLGGLVYFGLASLLAGLSSSLLILLVARVQQGIAGSILITNGFALVFASSLEHRRGRDLGLVTAALGLAAGAGPPLGGLLVGLAGWRAIFWVNIPIVMGALLLGWQAISENRTGQSKSRFDWLEIPSLFRRQTFAFANGAIMFSSLAMYTVLLAIPILMATRSSSSTVQSGLLLAAMSITIAVFSPVGGRLSDRVGRRLPGVAGIALLILGLLPLAILSGAINLPVLLASLALMGIGLGLSSVSLQTSALESAKLQQAGLATGIFTTSRYLGNILGSNILATILGPAPIEMASFRMLFMVVTVAAGIALLMSWGIRSEAQPFKKPSIDRFLENTGPDRASRVKNGDVLNPLNGSWS